jgi:hypothetical protein
MRRNIFYEPPRTQRTRRLGAFMKRSLLVAVLIFSVLVIVNCKKDSKDPTGPDSVDQNTHFKSLSPLPEPPDGFEWAVDTRFSDDFEGKLLDLTKWNDHHLYWKGRPPAKFMPEAVSVKEGNLRIRTGVLDDPDGDFYLQGGAVTSKSEQAHFGYYECRMKASLISMSSTFWMSGHRTESDYPRYSQELDIQEAIGGALRWPNFKTRMNSNTHMHVLPGPGEEQVIYSKGGNTPLSSNAGDDYHIYGAWWIDANTIQFYYNGEYRFTINPDTTVSKTPMANPMWINMVVETYDWEYTPSGIQVQDTTKNTTYYDWVRVFTLKEIIAN